MAIDITKIKFISCDIFKRGIYSFIGSLDQLKDWVNNKTKKEWSDEFIRMINGLEAGKIGVASYNYDNDGTGVILLPKYPETPKEYAYVTHEVIHATFILLDYCGVEYVRHTTNETFTYVAEHITRNVLDMDGYCDILK